MTASLTAQERIAAARDLLAPTSPIPVGMKARAAALLGRQALEGALDELWDFEAPGMRDCTARAQLLCLSAYVGDPLALNANHAFWALSRACHHHPYELSVITEEVARWLDAVEELVVEVQRRSTAPGSP